METVKRTETYRADVVFNKEARARYRLGRLVDVLHPETRERLRCRVTALRFELHGGYRGVPSTIRPWVELMPLGGATNDWIHATVTPDHGPTLPGGRDNTLRRWAS